MRVIFALCALLFFSGCASNSYIYGSEGRDDLDGDSRHVETPIIVGKPNKFLDASDWIWPGSLIGKLVLWNKDFDSHEVSPEIIDALALYIERNQLDDVQVLINTYKPGTQWVRTFKNQEVGAFWRYTLGILSASLYTVMPGRFFGGDHYNPYSNTISIYSDIPAVALHEGGHAKDFNRRKFKGIYAAIYGLPGVALYHEAVASNDALSYLRDNCMLEEEKAAYRILHPAYGTYVGGAIPETTYASALLALPGHITGAVAASKAELKPGCEGEASGAQTEQVGLAEEDAAQPTSNAEK